MRKESWRKKKKRKKKGFSCVKDPSKLAGKRIPPLRLDSPRTISLTRSSPLVHRRRPLSLFPSSPEAFAKTFSPCVYCLIPLPPPQSPASLRWTILRRALCLHSSAIPGTNLLKLNADHASEVSTKHVSRKKEPMSAPAMESATALRSVLTRVQQAAERSGMSSDQVRVVAVSKTKPVSVIRQVYDAGHRCFGENYVQEIVEKATQLPADIEWHFIGNLQSNKVKSLLAGVPNLDMVESIDDEKIANHLDRAVASLGRKPLKVLVQVNTSGEESKFGVDPSGCVQLVKHVKLGCPNLTFSGLMTIGMLDYSSTPENFETLSNCRAEVCKEFGIPEEECELSMGMSADFEQAIEMGSTNVRVGSTIFGAREYPKKDKSQ